MGTSRAAVCSAALLLVFVLFAIETSRADDGSAPAVSGINGKLSGEGGTFDNDAFGIGLGSISLPLDHRLALQIDAAAGYRDDNELIGGAGHLFYRDPSRFLLGGYGSFHSWGSEDIWRAAAEAEFYLGPVALQGLAGMEGVEGMRSHEHFFSIVDFNYYVNPDFRIFVGHRFTSMVHVGVVGAEYLFNSDQPTAVAVFVDARMGEGNYERLTAGLRIYFGGGDAGTLQYRHRHQDPPNRYPDLFSDDTPDGCPPGTVPFMGQCVIPE